MKVEDKTTFDMATVGRQLKAEIVPQQSLPAEMEHLLRQLALSEKEEPELA